jgi:L-asparaginase
MIDACVAAGARGLVAAGTGAGKVTEAQHAAFGRARAAGVAVVMSTRVMAGRVARTTMDAQHGYVAADSLSPQKARVLLLLALTRTSDPDLLQRMFSLY